MHLACGVCCAEAARAEPLSRNALAAFVLCYA